jgi:hypothetical protein
MKNERMMEHLLAEMKVNQENMEAIVKTSHEYMMAEIKTNHEELMAIMKATPHKREVKLKACLEATEVCLEKVEATIKAGQERMTAEIRTGLEEREANQGKTEAIVEPYKWALCIKATYVLNPHNAELLTFHMEPLKDGGSRRDDRRGRMPQQHKRPRHKTAAAPGSQQEGIQRATRQTPVLEVIKLSVGSSTRLWKTCAGHCGGASNLPNGRTDYRTYASVL